MLAEPSYLLCLAALALRFKKASPFVCKVPGVSCCLAALFYQIVQPHNFWSTLCFSPAHALQLPAIPLLCKHPPLLSPQLWQQPSVHSASAAVLRSLPVSLSPLPTFAASL